MAISYLSLARHSPLMQAEDKPAETALYVGKRAKVLGLTTLAFAVERAVKGLRVAKEAMGEGRWSGRNRRPRPRRAGVKSSVMVLG